MPEPLSMREAVQGRIYFGLQFLDEKLFVPVVEPLIFLGRNLNEGDEERFYFQNYESFLGGLRYENATDDEAEFFQVYGPDGGKHIFEYERALDGLMRCALARREAGV